MVSPNESERRLATILFADISGFTSLSERLDAELVTAAMNECFRILGGIVERNGGVIDKFIGDCVMALFGVPTAVEDAPGRAVRTALEMRDAIRALRGKGHVQAELDIHIGVNTGEVISGQVGSERKREYTVMGDAVNLASRLKDAAPKGRIFVGPQTWRLTKDGFEYGELEPVTLKGKENPVPVYELTSPRTAPVRSRAVFSPLVGRQREMDVLELQVLKAINGEGSIVHVIGEAGLGKSRLLAELRDKDCMRRVTLLEGRALSYGRNLSYHPIIDLVRKWAGIREEDGEAEALGKLESAIHFMGPEDAEETLPFLAVMMGIRLAGKHARRMEGIAGDALARLIFSSARELLVRGARRKPLVIVLEDLHWADGSTLDFVEHLSRMAEKEPVLFLNTFRPGEEGCERMSRAAREGLGIRYVEVALRPLDGDGGAELLRNLLKNRGFAGPAVERAAGRAGGNPFFLEEIVRAWIDERAVEAGREGFRVTEKVDSFEVPATVTELVMARFDRLDKESRDLLRVASVIGRGFFHRILARVAPSAGSLEETIRGLKERQIILERSRMEEVEYLFQHALAQEAIYGSILLQARRVLHLEVARAIESIFADRLGDFAGMLAWHYVRGEDFDKAEEYMIRAGENALHAAASGEAAAYYRDALELYTNKQGARADPAKIAMMETNIARSLFYRGRYAEALPYYDRLLRHYGFTVPAGRIATRLSAALGLVKILSFIRRPGWEGRKPMTPGFREGLVLTWEKSHILSAFDPSAFGAYALASSNRIIPYDVRGFEPGLMWLTGGSVLFSASGSFTPSRRVLETMRPLVGPELPHAWIFYLYCRSMHGYSAGDWGERVGLLDPEFRRQSERGSFLDVLRLCWSTGMISLEKGDWPSFLDARRMLEETSERFDSDDGRNLLHMAMMKYLVKRRLAREASDAVPVFQRFYASGTLSRWGTIVAQTFAGRAALLRGDFEGAVSASKEMQGRLRLMGHNQAKLGLPIHVIGMGLVLPATIAVERARRAAAEGRSVRAAVGEGRSMLDLYLCNAEKFAPDLTEALKLLGSYRWHAGTPRRALATWRRSIREAERLGARVELAHTYADAGALMGEAAPGPEWRKRGAALYAELGIGDAAPRTESLTP